ncbi:uncharacterized protein [Spinacia oleracea]|uniref:DUF4283 domain-containing protein n=1 Tax=Spinacia oleracea TaxID=3562 RepID=A0A9R0IQM7_SPIOL|nr:uncharacterized protein LOC110793237 [Spinacia oleracea]
MAEQKYSKNQMEKDGGKSTSPSRGLHPRSFREAVASSSQWFSEAKKIVDNTMEWNDGETMMPKNELSVPFSKLTLDRLRSPWKLCLMGKCMGINVRPNFMEARVRAMWRVKGSMEVIDLGKNVFLFRFTQTVDYERALFWGPWFILDHYLMITTWKPNFRPSINQFDTMSVWIRIEELPVEYYDKEALFAIARVVGKPIRVDYATDKVARAQFARCGIIGHDKQKCRSQSPTSQKGAIEKDGQHSPIQLDKGKAVLEGPLIPNQNNNDLGHRIVADVAPSCNGLQDSPT